MMSKVTVFSTVILLSAALVISFAIPVSATEFDGDSGCWYEICLTDDYGDGWNGGFLDVSVDASSIFTGLTLGAGTGPECHSFIVNTGDEITVEYTAGSWSYENEYYIYDWDSIPVRSEGEGGVTPGDVLEGELYAQCGATLWKELTSGPDVLDPTNLISHGDFQTGELNGARFRLGLGTHNEWYRLSPWQFATSGGNQYLNHACCGGGDQKAFQVIDASGMKAGAKLSLEFDYIYNPGDHQIQGVYAGLVGIKDDGIGVWNPGPCDNPDPPLYAANGGTEWDGWGFTFCGPNPESPGRANPDAFELASTNMLGVTGAGSFEEGSLEAVLDQEYDAIVVVLRADAYTSPWNTGIPQGMRSFDNIRLYASDGEIDLVVEKKPSEPIHYDFTITYEGEKEDVVVVDTIPAEWNVTKVDHTTFDPPLGCGESEPFKRCGTVIGELFKGGKATKKCHSATQLWWTHFMVDTLKIDAETRESPGKGHKDDVFAPTSCGALYLNEGAAAYPAVDGEPLLYEDPLHVSNALCVAVVSDNGDGIIVRNGSGDEDGDTLTDWEEACDIGTDPCLRDTDLDGVDDNVDDCPLEGPADPALGEIGEPNGCNRQSQCSDGIDNDVDTFIDFPDDLGCDDILDDIEAGTCEVPYVCGDDPIPECVAGAGSSCFCVESAEGVNSCIVNQVCDAVQACSASAECGTGEACIINTCCGGGVCSVVDICLDPLAPAATVDFSAAGLTTTGGN